MPVSFGVCTRALERNPPFAAWLRASGHDVLGHGYRWAEVDGRPWLVVPCTKVHNDTRYVLAPTYATPRHFAETLIGAADFLLDEARHGAGARLMSVGLHPRWSGQAARATAVRDFLAWAAGQPEVSWCTGSRSPTGGPSTSRRDP